jgi:FMN phosphatase YigB (HAD superfamily)
MSESGALVTRSIELVVFDVGSVLVRAGRSWPEDAARAGYEVSPAQWAELRQRLDALPQRSTGAIGSERYFALAEEAVGGRFTAADFRRVSEASVGEEYPGIGEVFDLLELKGVPSALLSNSNEDEWARYFPAGSGELEFPNLARASHRFGSHLLGATKPDPRAFRAVERATGRRGSRVLFFDDRLENVEAAQQLGWLAELIDYTGDTAAQMLVLLDHYGISKPD